MDTTDDISYNDYSNYNAILKVTKLGKPNNVNNVTMMSEICVETVWTQDDVLGRTGVKRVHCPAVRNVR